MITEAQLQSAAEFLARELMEWETTHHLISNDEWYCQLDKENCAVLIVKTADWQPYADTPEGLWQCFGRGGVVEKMRKKGWRMYFTNPSVETIFELAVRFARIVDDLDGTPWIYAKNPGAAIVPAVATALGWKEE